LRIRRHDLDRQILRERFEIAGVVLLGQEPHEDLAVEEETARHG